MTRTVQSLKEELEGTRQTLRHQTIRCRQLVLAYSTKMKETELKLKNSEELREKQLSHLLRVLYILEAKLRKEQKSIRKQLIEKDSVISKQRKEIESLQNRVECKRCFNKYNSMKREIECKTRTESSDDASCNSGSQTEDLSLENCKPDLISSITYPNTKCKIVKEKIQSKEVIPNTCDKQVKKSVKFDMNATRFKRRESFEIADVKTTEEDLVTSQDIPEQMNQILNKVSEPNKSMLSCDKRSSIRTKPVNQDYSCSLQKRDFEFQDNPVLECVNQILLRDKEDYLEDDKNEDGIVNPDSINSNKIIEKKISQLENLPVKRNKNQSNTENSKSPPSLPPKPLNLNWLGRKIFPSDQGSKIKSKLAFMKSQFSLDNFSLNTSTSQSSDDEIYVISNSALEEVDNVENKRNDDVREVNGEKVNTKSSNFSKDFRLSSSGKCKEDVENGNVEVLEENTKLDPSPKVSLMVRKFEDLRSHKAMLNLREDKEENDELRNNFEEFSFDDCEVASVGEKEELLETCEKPLSKIVTVNIPQENGVTYEKFLEATGLSQKSIVTPNNRIVNSRKIMMRPKDVKHRSRAKAAANYIDRCGTSEYVLGSTTKYWTEPFL